MTHRSLIIALGLSLGSLAHAQHSGHGHQHRAATPAAAAQPDASRSGSSVESDWVDGEVRRVDREQGRVTLRHEEIRALDMPPMTMVFHASDARQIESLAAGDRVRFRVVAEGSRYRITAIEKR